MAKQVQIQRTKPTTKRDTPPAGAPTTNTRIAKIWFGGQS